MKLLLLPLFIAFFGVSPVFALENESNEEAAYWTGRNHVQDKWLSSNPFRDILLRITRKPRPHQFIGLMGKRSMANAQITRKSAKTRFAAVCPSTAAIQGIDFIGHKINSFVGLMGKRSQEEPESYEWNTLQSYEKHR